MKSVAEECKKLNQYLWSRKVPPEQADVAKRSKEIEAGLASRRLQKQSDTDDLTDAEIEKVG